MKKSLTASILTVAAAVAVVWLIWTWGFCRFYVHPNYMAVITAKVGTPLPPGRILAGPGQKGIRQDVLGEGRHFLNPILYEREILPVTIIKPGKIGVVTAKVGDALPEGEFLADPDQKGIWRRVLGPGKYRLNPYGYTIDVVDAISIPVGYAGVITSLSGRQGDPDAFAGPDEKGVRRDILQPGLYYVNPKEFKVDVLEVGVNQVSLLGKGGGEVITKGQLESQNVVMEELQTKVLQKQKEKRFDYLARNVQSQRARLAAAAPTQAGAAAPTREAAEQEAMDLARVKEEYLQGSGGMAALGLDQFIEFPSRDGFQIRLDMTVEIELPPSEIAWIFSRYGDLPAVVDKIIMPQITSISRNKGSEYRAKDFIVGEGREKFQNDLTQSLAERLGEKNIVVHNALIRHVEVPPEILDPIQQASIAIEQDLTNKEKQNTAKIRAELNTEVTLIAQRREQVARETQKIRAEIKADQEKQVAEIRAQTTKQAAEIARDTAGIKARTVRRLAEAEAAAIKLVQGEEASGLQLKADAFDNPGAFALWELAAGLSDALSIRILHAGEGTLWTDLDKARLGDLGGAAILRRPAPAP
jgi:regulator of protease activity HflC (stomatin/prohibitin superfamily)